MSAPRLLALLLLASGCQKPAQAPASTPPTVGELDSAAAAEEEPAPPPRDSFVVGTFNLQWAHDHRSEGPSAVKKARAKDEEAWTWKAEAIAKVLIRHAPEIVALQELGGEDELYDIMAAIKQGGGPEYDYAYLSSDDPFTGHQVAVLSTFRLTNVRRLDIHLRRHVVVDVDLPDDQEITVVAVHAPEGDRAASSRDKQLEALKRGVEALRSTKPVVVLGTFGMGTRHTDPSYPRSAAGKLAGRHTRDEADDCFDSVAVGAMLSTTTAGGLADRIYACGLEMIDADAHEEGIVIGMPDDDRKRWSDIPVDERDVSDHLLVTAEIKLPKPSPDPDEDDESVRLTASR